MRTLSLLFTIAVFSVDNTCAQHLKTWEFGLQVEFGRDWYHRNYYQWESSLPNGYIQDFPSYHSTGAGVFAERTINPRFSVLGQLGYAQKKMPVDMYGEPSTTGARWVRKELHHRGAADLGLRWYVNPNASVRFFADVKLGANVLIAAAQHIGGSGNEISRDAFGYGRTSPTASGSVGIKWKRLALSAEYRRDLLVVKRYHSATGIKGQMLAGKLGVSLFK